MKTSKEKSMDMYEVIVRAIIKDEQGRVLLTKRAKDPEKNKWCLVGGKVKFQEKAIDGIIREVKEELNVNFTPTFYTYTEFFGEAPYLHCIILYFVGPYTGKIKIKEDELLDVKFYSKEEVEKAEDIAWHKPILMKYLK